MLVDSHFRGSTPGGTQIATIVCFLCRADIDLTEQDQTNGGDCRQEFCKFHLATNGYTF